MFCRKCGAEIKNDTVICIKCGVAIEEKVNKDPYYGKMIIRSILPVGRSGYAIAAGYLAFFSIFLIPGPFALLFGILGIWDIKRDSEKHGMGRAIFGVTAGLISTIILIYFLISGKW